MRPNIKNFYSSDLDHLMNFNEKLIRLAAKTNVSVMDFTSKH